MSTYSLEDEPRRSAYMELYPLGDARTLVLTEGHVRVEAKADLDDVAARLVADPPDALRAGVEGALQEAAPAPDRVPAATWVVLGSGRLAEVLAGLDAVPRSWPDVLGSLEPGTTYVVPEVAWSSADAPRMEDWTSKVRWLPARLFKGVIEVGPLLGPGAQCRYADLLGRRRAAAYSSLHDQALGEPAKVLNDYPAEHYHRAYAVLRRALEESAARPGEAETTVYCAEIGSGWVRRRPIHALPDAKVPRPRRDLASLIDEEHGLILRTRRITHHRSAPPTLVTVQADVGMTSRVYPFANNSNCQGSVFGDYEAARMGAIGESVERYCANMLDTLPRITASWNDLASAGVRAIDPDQLVLHSPEQYATPGFPLVPFTRELPVSWVPGWSVTTDRATWAPASLVYVNYKLGPYAQEPPTNIASYPGIAAGSTREQAIVSGIEEVVERHATMIWWHNRLELPRLQLPDSVAQVWSYPGSQVQSWSALRLPNEFDIPVVAGIVENTQEELFNIGFAARPRLAQATLKAWTEALTLQEGSRDLLNPNGAYRQAFLNGKLSGKSMKEHRDDRLYMDSYRSDFRDINDLMCQQQFYLDPRARQAVAFLVDTPQTARWEPERDLAVRTLQEYRRRIEPHGYEIIVVDVTTPDVASAGLHVVRVLIPGLVPNFPAGFPMLGREALQMAPVRLGLRDHPLSAGELHYFPLPHA